MSLKQWGAASRQRALGGTSVWAGARRARGAWRAVTAALGAALLAAGCSADGGGGDESGLMIGTEVRTESIVRPIGEATMHPYACAIRMGAGGACSGALVARNVVLTASHCVAGARTFSVTCPYSGDPSPVAGSEAVMSPTGGRSFRGSYITPESGSDVALIHLDRDIPSPRYGSVRLDRVAPPLRVFVVGRINHGSFTNRLWVSPTFTAVHRYGPGTPPYAIGANTGVTQPGDSGGALFDAATGEIVGTVSGGSSATSIYGVVGAHPDWFRMMLERWSGSAPPPPPPGDGGVEPPDAGGGGGGSGSECGRYEGWTIRSCVSATEWVRCASGRLERGTCAGRCIVRPPGYDDVCAPPAGAGEACGMYSYLNVFTCNRDRTQRVICAGGNLIREPCARGCVTRPAGVDDVCAP